ncbi:hypothetical protein BDK92_7091 [Micromonospora pisi]|uniref:Uncharacterized protein n=1 Tax=Micromonospora pisi TaxID=589240 RepID=A0A495JWV0_9ACTN|nr:hypothetical protein [Micromonospora pisi]RKR92649.1 hypothetical protein BDK92_7091 [Micromonospora pisi]
MNFTALPAPEDDDLSALAAANMHTDDSRGLAPGVYLSDPQGHAQLVGTNDRAVIVVDLGGVIQVGGINVEDADHLERFAARLTELAARLRKRQTEGDPNSGAPAWIAGLTNREGAASKAGIR